MPAPGRAGRDAGRSNSAAERVPDGSSATLAAVEGRTTALGGFTSADEGRPPEKLEPPRAGKEEGGETNPPEGREKPVPPEP